MKTRARKAILWPDLHVVSSQTLYESLLGCIDLYEATGDDFWADQSGDIARLIVEHQNPDGGFNIGFQFVFGTDVYKSDPNESTAPELLSLYALYKYQEVFGDQSFNNAIEKAIRWILRFAYQADEGKYAVPYAPYSVSDAHIVNGTSFALPGLAYYCRNNPQDKKAAGLVRAMVHFLKDELEPSPDGNGMYFRYFHKGSERFCTEAQQEKIDNYHIAQQIRYHIAVQELFPCEDNLFIIDNLLPYLLSRQDADSGVIRYCEDDRSYPRDIHSWGFSSCIKGFSSAYRMTGDEQYKQAAHEVLDWLLLYAFNGDYFYPILQEDGSIADDEFYVRSNAWVFHSLAHYLKYVQFDQMIYEICRNTYQMIYGCRFKGYDIKVWNRQFINGSDKKETVPGSGSGMNTWC